MRSPGAFPWPLVRLDMNLRGFDVPDTERHPRAPRGRDQPVPWATPSSWTTRSTTSDSSPKLGLPDRQPAGGASRTDQAVRAGRAAGVLDVAGGADAAADAHAHANANANADGRDPVPDRARR